MSHKDRDGYSCLQGFMTISPKAANSTLKNMKLLGLLSTLLSQKIEKTLKSFLPFFKDLSFLIHLIPKLSSLDPFLVKKILKDYIHK